MLDIFLRQVKREFHYHSYNEKLALIVDTLNNRALRQYLMYVDIADVIETTVHGAKGLEWDYVIIPDMEEDSFPAYLGACRGCMFKSNGCIPDWKNLNNYPDLSRKLYSELNLFYVASTRARKSAVYSYSSTGCYFEHMKEYHPSCYLSLPGIELNRI